MRNSSADDACKSIPTERRSLRLHSRFRKPYKRSLVRGQRFWSIRSRNLHTSKDVVQNASHWFDKLWKDAHSITEADLSAAKAAWKKARQGSPLSGNRKRRNSGSRSIGPHLPPDWEPSRKLLKLAKKIKILIF